MYLLGYMYHFPESPNASKTTNNIVTVKKYIDTYLLPCQEKTFPLARLFFCQVLLGCDESIDWYTTIPYKQQHFCREF